MTKYMLNKLLYEVDGLDEALSFFKADPAGFIRSWESRWEDPRPPIPSGGRLDEEERRAVASKDYGALYAMGANPFLLWQFARSVSVPDEMDVDSLVIRFRQAVAPHGYPDFHT